MREKGIRKIQHWILIIAAVIMSVLMVLTALQEKPQKVWGKDSSLYKWDTGWYCDADGGGEEICKVPSRIKSSSGAVVLRQDIPEFLEEEKYLGFLNHYQQAEVYIDGERRYQYLEEETGAFCSMLGNTLCMIKLNREDAGKELTLRISNFYKAGQFQIPVIYLDSQESMFMHVQVQEQPRLIFCVVLLVLSAGLFLLWLLLRVREACLLYTSRCV